MRLPLPAACSIAIIGKIVAERQSGKNASFFSSIELEWCDRVREYLNYAGSPEYIQAWPEIDCRRNTFHNLYNSAGPGSAHGDAIEPIRNHDLDICPACGEFGAPNTLDHYLPKGKFPHFSIVPANLVPMCDACQGKKLEKTGDLETPRFFIHPYFDTFSIPRVVDLIIWGNYEVPTFELRPHPRLQEEEASLVATHLRELNIPGRYIRFFRNENRRLIKNVTKMRKSGQHIRETIEGFLDGFSDPIPNSWQYIFYTGVLNNDNYIRYLEAGELPRYP